MSADDLVQFLSQALYLVVFAFLVVGAARSPRRATVDMALLFGASAAIVGETWVTQILKITPPLLLSEFGGLLLIALPYLLLRLVDDFSGVPRWLLWSAAGELVALALVVAVFGPAIPGIVAPLAYLAFFALIGYVTVEFGRSAVRATGITRWRMAALAAGSLALGLDLVVSFFGTVAPGATLLAAHLLGLISGLGYFIGFAPPRWLRRAWQAPYLYRLYSESSRLAHLSDERLLIGELEAGIAAAMGLPWSWIGLWNESKGVLAFQNKQPVLIDDGLRSRTGTTSDGSMLYTRPGVMIAGDVFESGKPAFLENAARSTPEYAEVYRTYGVTSAMAAPILSPERRMGVVVLYNNRAPLFAEDDLELLVQLADHAGMVIETRSLVQERAEIQAAQALEQMKDEFLSAAAHDLKTPLTAIKGVAQIMGRRMVRTGTDVYLPDVKAIDSATDRMTGLIDELLDVAKGGREQLFALRPEPTDLVAIVGQVLAGQQRAAPNHELCLVADEATIQGDWDAARLERAITNLVANAVKYSPRAGRVVVTVRREQRDRTDWAVVEVSDTGIGIPAADIAHVFDRFFRAANARRGDIGGTGIGLAYVRQIARQHGGDVTARSVEGQGSTFTFAVPLAAVLV